MHDSPLLSRIRIVDQFKAFSKDKSWDEYDDVCGTTKSTFIGSPMNCLSSLRKSAVW